MSDRDALEVAADLEAYAREGGRLRAPLLNEAANFLRAFNSMAQDALKLTKELGL